MGSRGLSESAKDSVLKSRWLPSSYMRWGDCLLLGGPLRPRPCVAAGRGDSGGKRGLHIRGLKPQARVDPEAQSGWTRVLVTPFPQKSPG